MASHLRAAGVCLEGARHLSGSARFVRLERFMDRDVSHLLRYIQIQTVVTQQIRIDSLKQDGRLKGGTKKRE